MAQKPQKSQQERTTTSTTPATRATQNTVESAATPKPGILSRVPAFLMPRPQPAATATGAKPQSPFRKLIFGMLILFVGMNVLEYVLIFVAAKFNLNLNAPLGKNVPIIGGLSWFYFLWLLLIFALYIALLRFGIIPSGKTMRAQRDAASARPAAPAATTHAARKRAARHAATTTAATVSTARRPAFLARFKSGQGQSGQGQSGKSVKSGTTTAKTASSDGISGISDDVYERAKAAQRLRRRRESKR